jgi:hypothetical protein
VGDAAVVIVLADAATDVGPPAVAWQVISGFGQGETHPFVFPDATAVVAEDAWGNFTPPQTAQPGELFSMTRQPSGDVLGEAGPASSPDEIQVLNGLPQGAINASVSKDGKVFATMTSIAPQQMAVFRPGQTICIGAVSDAVEGQPLSPAGAADVSTQLDLTGIVSADIVMTGGGPDPTSPPVEFALANVVLVG